MGAVWRARDRRLRRDVAVKLLHSWIAEDLELRRRFAREARVLAPLEHEHIVRLYDYGEDGETPFLVMELVDGANLARRRAEPRASAGTQACRDRAADRVCARLRARARDRPPRPHPGQRADRERLRPRRRLGLRPRADRPLDDERDDPGHAARDARVLVARAGPRAPTARRRRTCTRSAACSSGCSSGRTPFEGDDRLAVGLRRAHEAAPSLLSCAPGAPPEAAALVDALLSPDPADRPTAVEVLERLGVAAPAIQEAVADAVEAAERPTAVFAEPLETAVLEAPRRHPARKRRRGRRMALVAVGIAAAAALAFVGATIANADRVVEVPRVTGMTVPQARVAARRGGARRCREGPARDRSRSYSETVEAGHVIAQSPAPSTRVERADLDVVLRVSRGTALAVVPDVEGASQSDATAALRRIGFAVERSRAEESWETPEGRVISSDVAARRRGAAAGADRHRGLERPAARIGARRARRSGRRRRRAARRQLRRRASSRRDPRPPPQAPCCASRPGSRHARRARLDGDAHGRARARSGGRPGRSPAAARTTPDAIEVTAPQGKWRIVVELHPRYLIFGSGSATFSWEGTGAGSIALDSVGSDEVAPLSGAGSYRLHVHPHGSVTWTMRIEQLG